MVQTLGPSNELYFKVQRVDDYPCYYQGRSSPTLFTLLLRLSL